MAPVLSIQYLKEPFAAVMPISRQFTRLVVATSSEEKLKGGVIFLKYFNFGHKNAIAKQPISELHPQSINSYKMLSYEGSCTALFVCSLESAYFSKVVLINMEASMILEKIILFCKWNSAIPQMLVWTTGYLDIPRRLL